MKKSILFMATLLLFCSFFNLEATAATYKDEMDSLENNGSKAYYNLSYQGAGSDWGGLADKTCLAIANPRNPRAYVTYRLSNLQKISANIYSTNGTTVCRAADGSYQLGIPGREGLAETALQAKYSPSADRCYIFPGGETQYLTYKGLSGYVFKKCADSPTDLITYGISFWSSSDGVSFQALPSSRVSSVYNGASMINSEQWTVAVGGKTQYLRVEINDISFVDSYDDQQSYPKATITMTMLASVELKGDRLSLGEPEPIIPEEIITSKPEEVSVEESSKAESQSSKKVAAKAAVKEEPPENTSSSEANKESSEKFEGTVVIDDGRASSRRGGGGGGAAAETSKVESVITAESSPPEPDTPDQLYYIEGSGKPDSFSTVVGLYIVVISVAVLFVLIYPQLKKRGDKEDNNKD